MKAGMNAGQWVSELEGLWKGLKSGRVKPTVAREMNQTASNVIGFAKVTLEMARMRGADSAPAMPLLANGSSRKALLKNLRQG
jgi:hypothetical protein